MHVLVTGGAGFIGSHIVRELLERGHRVTVLDDLCMGRRENLPPGADLREGSILAHDALQACDGVDAVLHAAAQTSVAHSVSDPQRDALINILGTIAVLSAAERFGVKRFVYLSSAAVYGAPEQLPIGEEHRQWPASPYGLSKLVGERYTRLLRSEWSILRLANVYGPHQSTAGEAGVIARWCAALAAGRPLELHGDGAQTRDFLYVQDAAAAAVSVLERPGGSGQIFNVGTGTATALRELLPMLEAVSDRTAEVRPAPVRPGDIGNSWLDSGRIRQSLGWEPQVSLREGLARTFGWAASEMK